MNLLNVCRQFWEFLPHFVLSYSCDLNAVIKLSQVQENRIMIINNIIYYILYNSCPLLHAVDSSISSLSLSFFLLMFLYFPPFFKNHICQIQKYFYNRQHHPSHLWHDLLPYTLVILSHIFDMIITEVDSWTLSSPNHSLVTFAEMDCKVAWNCTYADSMNS